MDRMNTGGPPVERLSSLLKGVTLNDDVAREKLFMLFDELKECYEAQERATPAEFTGEQDEELKHLCTEASLLFVARVLFVAQSGVGRNAPGHIGCPISRIVAAAGINLLDFFREVHVVVSKLSAYFEARGGSSRIFTQQAQLKENSETVVVMGLLAKKYKDNFNLFLHQLDFFKQVVLRLGWSAFLVLRIKLLSTFPDVVSCVELLPCVFAVLASHAPRLPDCLSHLNQDSKLLLKALSDMCKADYSRVLARMSSVEPLLSQILTAAVPEWRTALYNAKTRHEIAAEEETLKFGCAIDLVSNPVLEGLVTDAVRMQRALDALESEYEKHYEHGGSELDEREFLFTDFTKFASPRFSPGHMQSAITKMRLGPMPLRQGALLGPGAHTTAPSSVSPRLNFRVPMSAGMHSPLPVLNLSIDTGQPSTPVSEVMNISAWLRGRTANLAAEPSPGLTRYLAAVGGTRSEYVTGSASTAHQLGQRVRDLISSIIPEEKIPSLVGAFPLLQPSLTAERRLEVTKLYYHSLDNILHTEEKVGGMAGVTSLLSAGKFHRALVACCIEVVAACYRMVSCAFPKVLDALHIKAFDLAKMIPSFVKSIETLPRELKRHLFLIEEKIIESLAWEPGSSLYTHIVNISVNHQDITLNHNALHVAEDALQHAYAPLASPACKADCGDGVEELNETNGTRHSAPSEEIRPIRTTLLRPLSFSTPLCAPPPSPKRSQGCIMGSMSPAKKVRGVDGSPQPVQVITGKLPLLIGAKVCGAAGASGSAGALHDFCRKVLKLAAFRLALMCDNFDFSPLDRVEVNAKVYETIEYALYNQTHLFYNRHIDQIILSALYGYCKVHKLVQVSFREIIGHYRKQPQAQQCIFRSVIIEQSNPGLQVSTRADIIAFYNQVFVPSMKSFLLKGETRCASTCGQGLDGEPGTVISISETNSASACVTGGSRNTLPLLTLHNTARLSRPVQLVSMSANSSPTAVSRSYSVKDSVATQGGNFMDKSCGPICAGSAVMGESAQTFNSHSHVVQHICNHGGRSATVAVTGHQIPDGLAALLQALDSQQGLQDQGCMESDCLCRDASSTDCTERRSSRRLRDMEDAISLGANQEIHQSCLAGRLQE
uniref:MAT3m n=2 Tax=Volvox carteri f. nagariensis TaxID=3068 RepID=D9CJ65_VOLCA|nr:MAT3m [Volvox carteri f. nagariensis]